MRRDLRGLLVVAVVAGVSVSRPAGARSVELLIVGSVDGQTPETRPVQARLGERVSLYAVVKVRGRRGVRYYTSAPVLRIKRRRIPRRQVWPWTELYAKERVRWAWWQVEPAPHHVSLAPPNQGNPAYSNAVLFGPHHGRWLGYDTIEYQETVMAGATGPVLRLTRVTPSHPQVNVHGGLGTMRYRVALTMGSQRLSSPGVEAVGREGIKPSVMRVSFRAGDDLVGHLTSYYNVPNVFGSAGPTTRHQTELYQGADCADIIIGAARRAGARIPYSSVTGLRRYARPVTGTLRLTPAGLFRIVNGAVGPPVRLRYGQGGGSAAVRLHHGRGGGAAPPPRRCGRRDGGAPADSRNGPEIRRGDIMLINYRGFDASPRLWDHVAVVAGDAGEPGVFDPEDRVMHVSYLWGLAEVAARHQSPATVQFLRFKPRLFPARRRHRPRATRPGTAPRRHPPGASRRGTARRARMPRTVGAGHRVVVADR